MTEDLALLLNIRNPIFYLTAAAEALLFVMSGAVVCQAVSVRVVGDNRLKVIFRRSVCQIINDVSAAEAAGRFSPKRGRGFQCRTVHCSLCSADEIDVVACCQ